MFCRVYRKNSMNKIYFTFLFCFSLLALANGQSVQDKISRAEGKVGHQIDFELKNYENDSLIIAYYFGDRHLVLDTLISEKKGKFQLAGPDKLKPGVYLMMTRPNGKYVQFMVNEQEQHFKLKTDGKDLGKLKFKNSQDNKLFYDYMEFLSVMRPRAEFLNDQIKDLDPADPEHILKSRELSKLDKEVADYQLNLVSKNPDALTSKIILSNLSIDVPEFEGDEEQQRQKKFDYYKEHFFDNIDLGNVATLRTPFIHTKIDRYIKKLTVQSPDSLIKSMDYILEKLKPAEESYKFYLTHFLNNAAKSKVVGQDAIYVHLMDNYYSKGLAPWADEKNLKKMQKNANRLRPVLIGKTIDDITLYQEDGSPFKLSDVETKYTVIMFWAPDCGHCKKAMPAAIEFNEKFKDRDVSFLAVCTKTKDKYASCWEAIEEKNMGGFLNLGDQYAKSRFKTKFNVRTTPKIFILDDEREILMKNVGSEQLEEGMEQIMRFEEMEDSN